jgi:hypothetical protein
MQYQVKVCQYKTGICVYCRNISTNDSQQGLKQAPISVLGKVKF